MMRLLSCAALLAGLFSISTAARAAAPEIYRASGSGQLTIGVDGSVQEVKLDQSFGKQIDVPLKGKLSAWRFQPIVEQGRAVEAIAHFRLVLQADLSKDAADLRIVDADFVDPPSKTSKSDRRKITPPRYPKRAIQNRFGAEVELVVRIDEQGEVQDVAAKSGWLTGPAAPESELRTQYDGFVEASAKAVRTWDFSESAAKSDRVLSVPISFFIDTDTPWRRSFRVEQVPAPWLVAHEGQAVAELGPDGSPVSQRIHLLSELDG